jgi:hypothetical protein
LVYGVNQLTNKADGYFKICELEVWQIKNIEANNPDKTLKK